MLYHKQKKGKNNKRASPDYRTWICGNNKILGRSKYNRSRMYKKIKTYKASCTIGQEVRKKTARPCWIASNAREYNERGELDTVGHYQNREMDINEF